MSNEGQNASSTASGDVTALFDAAVRLHQRGEFREAEPIYRRILEAEPDHAGALHLLGVARHQQGDHAAALEYIGRAMAIGPPQGSYCNNYGAALLALGRNDEAAGHFRRALELRPNYADALANLGQAEAALGRPDAAIAHYRNALAVDPNHVKAARRLGTLLQKLGRTEEAVEAYRRALAIEPNHATTHFNLGGALEELHEIPEARRHFGRAADLRPDKRLWRLRSAACVPSVLPSNQAIDAYRAELSAALEQWKGRLPDALDGDELAAAGACPLLALSYHGRDNRAIKEQFASLFEPYFRDEPDPQGSGQTDRLRVGFLVTRRHESLFVRCMRGVIEGLDAQRFEPVVLCWGGVDALQRGVRPDIRVVSLGESFSEAVQDVRATACDVLYYWEVGSDPINYFLPFVRLAPVQCTGWASTVTTGIAAVDYFYSSERIDPPGAEAEYTEKLWRSKSLFCCEPRTTFMPGGTIAGLGLPDDCRVYLCPQNPFKLHPDVDPLFAEILARDSKARIVLGGRRGRAGELLRGRLAANLKKDKDRVTFLPWLNTADFHCLLQRADVILDPPHYSAGSSCYDLFSFNLPVVTWPGRSIVSRVTAGFYKKMGVDALIASSPEQYVELAIRVATDLDYRVFVREQIARSSGAIFDDIEAVREFDRFLSEACSAAVSDCPK